MLFSFLYYFYLDLKYKIGKQNGGQRKRLMRPLCKAATNSQKPGTNMQHNIQLMPTVAFGNVGESREQWYYCAELPGV